MTDYKPIDCGLHSEYELAIMQHCRLHLTWQGRDGVVHMEIIMPTDLYTRQGEEFIIISRADGSTGEIRLDHIIRYRRA